MIHSQRYSRPKVLISTLAPLGGNYGGVLQAYALQAIINSLGAAAVTIDEPVRVARFKVGIHRLRHRAYAATARAQVRPIALTADETLVIREHPLKFVEANIDTIFFHELTRKEQDSLLDDIDALVVGSDQVWRAPYATLKHQFLHFARGRRVARLAYAASFGRDDLSEYSSSQRRLALKSVQEFDAVSVREDSGVQICMDEWGVKATHVVDPTLLLDAEAYRTLAAMHPDSASWPEGCLVDYILDDSDWKGSFTTELATNLGVEKKALLTVKPRDARALRAHPERYQMRSVEEWLQSIQSARVVVTDSFHGTVFSILFNKPFFVVGNEARGTARIESLLREFGLSDRFVRKPAQIVEVTSMEEPNWTEINSIIAEKRTEGIQFLSENLSKMR